MENHIKPISDGDLSMLRSIIDTDRGDIDPIFFEQLFVRLDNAEADNKEFSGLLNKNYEELKLPAALAALQDCIDTAAELRRNISPDQGCGYRLYKETWDASFAAEIRAKLILAQLT